MPLISPDAYAAAETATGTLEAVTNLNPLFGYVGAAEYMPAGAGIKGSFAAIVIDVPAFDKRIDAILS